MILKKGTKIYLYKGGHKVITRDINVRFLSSSMTYNGSIWVEYIYHNEECLLLVKGYPDQTEIYSTTPPFI